MNNLPILNLDLSFPFLIGDVFEDMANDFLADNPLVLAGLAMIFALVFGIFAYIGITRNLSWTKKGKRIEGNAAKFKGWVFAGVSVLCVLFAIFKTGQAFMGGFGLPSFVRAPSGFGREPGSAPADFEKQKQKIETQVKETKSRFQPSKLVGNKNKQHVASAFVGPMVGMLATTNDSGELQSLIPLFVGQSRISSTHEFGQRGANSELILAKPNYVVAAIQVYSDQSINAVQLIYVRHDQQRIFPDDSYQSDWIGHKNGSLDMLGDRSSFVAGFESNHSGNRMGLQVFSSKSQSDPVFNRVAMPVPQPSKSELLASVKSASTDSPIFANRPNRSNPTGDSGPDNSRHNEIASSIAADIEAQRKKMEEDMVATQKEMEEHREEVEKRVSESMKKAEERFNERRESTAKERTTENQPKDEVAKTSTDDTRKTMSDLQPGEATDLGLNEVPLPALKYDLTKAQLSEFAGFDLKGSRFEAHGPDSSILVGMVVGYGKGRDKEIKNLRPIYLLDDKYFYGELIGASSSDSSTNLLARPGYAVGGVHLRTAIGINSLQLIYLEIGDSGRLNKREQYLSETVGETSGREQSLYADGWHIVGLFGFEEDDKVLGIGLVGINARPDTSVQRSPKVDLSQPRTWVSANGQFKVEAKFVKIANGKVELLRSDNGKSIEVELALLCEADQKILDENSSEKQ